MLNIYLFGTPRFERDGEAVHIGRRKTVALAAYLAGENRPTSREALATLLWPEHDQAAALKGLRRELARLRRHLDDASVSATRSQLHLNTDPQLGVAVDVLRFRRHLQLVQEHDHFPEANCALCLEALQAAVTLYGDDFTAGFNLPNCPDFDRWQDFQRESLRQELGQALEKLAIWHVRQGAYYQATGYARRWLGLDPLQERARRLLMQAYAEAGQQALALKSYEEGVQLLEEELGIAPDVESRQLAAEIRAGQFPRMGEGALLRTKGNEKMAGRRQRRHYLPQQPSPFVGRDQELTMIQVRLQEAGCRLLTLVGPGGIGKTRLAIEVGRRLLAESEVLFPNGIFFVTLGAVNTIEDVAPAMMEAAGFPLYGDGSAEEQLLEQVHHKRLLFILDNIEHLSAARELITAVLSAAPGVKILTTSTTALRLREEWFHPVGGLSVPPAVARRAAEDGEVTSPLAYDAVQLFEQRAHQASPTFSLDEELEAVVRICRLVEGMPLALELAAAWLRVLDAKSVARELEQNLDLLAARFCNLPERHQSLRAVFEKSWAMLTAAEQEALARLSIFRDGFVQEAALDIAGMSLFVLSSLVEKSLVQREGDKRYRLHGLLRQFAAERLAEMGQVEQCRASHSHYFMALLKEWGSALKGAEQRKALKQIKGDLENIREAWNWILADSGLPAIDEAIETLFLYFFLRGRDQEGVNFLESAGTSLALSGGQKTMATWGRILARVSLMKSHLLLEAGVEAEVEESLRLAQEQQDEAEIAFCHFVKGIYNTLVKDNAEVAIRAYERARIIYQKLDDSFYLAQVLTWAGFTYGNNGRLDRFFALTREALALARGRGHESARAHALSNLVEGAIYIGDYPSAEQDAHEVGAMAKMLDLPSLTVQYKGQLSIAYLLRGKIDLASKLAEEAHSLAHEIHHPLSLAHTRTLLAWQATIRGDYVRGKVLAEESLATPAARFGVILGHWVLALANCGLGENEAAWREALVVLEMARRAGFVGVTTWPLPVLAVVLGRTGQSVRAAELLGLAQSHPLSPSGWYERWPLLLELRRSLQTTLGREAFAAAWERGVAADLASVVAALLEDEKGTMVRMSRPRRGSHDSSQYEVGLVLAP